MVSSMPCSPAALARSETTLVCSKGEMQLAEETVTIMAAARKLRATQLSGELGNFPNWQEGSNFVTRVKREADSAERVKLRHKRHDIRESIVKHDVGTRSAERSPCPYPVTPRSKDFY